MALLTEVEMRSMRILLTEETPLGGKMLSALLERRGHSAVVAANGRKAIVELVRGVFDCVLMDLSMPEEGLAAIDAIRSSVTEQVDASIPIVGLAPSLSAQERDRYLQAGLDGVLVKPVRINPLLKTIHDVMVRKGLKVLGKGDFPAKPLNGQLRSKKGIEKEFGLLSEDVDELYRGLLDSVSQEYSALRVAVMQGWQEEAADIAHSMAGSTLDIVAVGPTLLAREIEYAARGGEMQSLLPLCDELEMQLDRVLDQIVRTLAVTGDA